MQKRKKQEQEHMQQIQYMIPQDNQKTRSPRISNNAKNEEYKPSGEVQQMEKSRMNTSRKEVEINVEDDPDRNGNNNYYSFNPFLFTHFIFIRTS